jgi:tRNA (cmo5U34)-methyltransferase
MSIIGTLVSERALMPSHWQRPEEAADWDAGGGAHLPTRAEQQDLLLALLAGIGDGAVLDLGIGSGLVAEKVLDALPRAELVGVDFSSPMLELARERLRRFGGRVRLCAGDLSAPHDIDLPHRRYQAVFSVQTLHHLSDGEKSSAFAWMTGLAEPGGLVVVIDRVKVEEALFDDWQIAWRRLDPTVSGTYAEFVAELVEAGDRPSALEDHLAWMKAAGLAACCLQLYGDRAVLVGRKAG